MSVEYNVLFLKRLPLHANAMATHGVCALKELTVKERKNHCNKMTRLHAVYFVSGTSSSPV